MTIAHSPLLGICDDTTFFYRIIFLKNIKLRFFISFHTFLGLKPNLEISKIMGIGVLKGVQMTLCGMRCIDLNNDTLKLLCTHFPNRKN